MNAEQAEIRLEEFSEAMNINANSDGMHLLYYMKHPDSDTATAWISGNLEDDEKSLLTGFCSICRVVIDTLMGNFERSKGEVIEDLATAIGVAFDAPAEIFHMKD